MRYHHVCALILAVSLGEQVVAAPLNQSSEQVAKPAVTKVDPSTASLTPEQLIKQLQKAYHHENYELSYIRVRRGSIEPMRLFHGVINDQEVVHRLHLNGPVREVVRRNDRIAYYEFGQPPYSIQGSRLSGMMAAIAQVSPATLSRNYSMIISGKSRIAGRSAQVVRITPKSDRLYGLYLWIGERSYLPLRIDIVDPNGQLVEQQMSIDVIRFKKPTQWIKKLNTIRFPPLRKQSPRSSSVTMPDWQVSWKPKGFHKIAQDHHQLPITGQAIDYMRFSDGVFNISVYASLAKQSQVLQGEIVRQGATSLQSVRRGPYEFTIVGEIPPQTAILMAKSVKLLPVSKPKLAKDVADE